MTEKDINDRINKIIREDIGIQAEYSLNDSLLTTGVMDSMDWMAFLTRVEDEFAIEISSEDADQHSVAIPKNIVAYLKARLV